MAGVYLMALFKDAAFYHPRNPPTANLRRGIGETPFPTIRYITVNKGQRSTGHPSEPLGRLLKPACTRSLDISGRGFDLQLQQIISEHLNLPLQVAET
jgi:hypothetical protein